MSEPSGWVGIWVSIAALGVSTWAVVSSRSISTRANQLQERLLRLEGARERDRVSTAQRADVVAFVANTGGSCRMFFRNEGQGTARAIAVYLDGRPIAEHPVAVADDTPPATLSPKGEAHVLLAPAMGSPDRARVRVTWEDDSGAPGAWESDLKLV